MKNCKIYCNGLLYEAPEGVCLGDFLRERGFDGLVCGGHGKCGKCRVTVSGSLSEPTETEKKALSGNDLKAGVRLACQTYVKGDCTVNTKENGSAVVQTGGAALDYPLMPSFEKYGAAIDIGTTTVALRLYDAHGALLSVQSGINPQRRYGADVVSRMEAALSGSAADLASLIRKYLCSLLRAAAYDAGIKAADIDSAVITGNTVMLHFLTQTDTEPLTHAPFAVKRLFGETLSAGSLGLDVLCKETPVYLPRCVSAFVGADTVTALVSVPGITKRKTCVLTDIGTNGETVLIHDGALYACSTAAGPAFEGAGITMGMGGSDGAIDKVTVNDGRISAHVIGEVPPVGICGSGIVDAVASFAELQIIDETGYMEDGEAVVISPVVITEKDIRAVQLAKSAIHAGIKTLLDSAGLTCSDAETLYIAGGFGSYLDVKNAARIGLIPKELQERVTVLGNAALSGAAALLLSSPLKESSYELANNVKLVNLASNPVFVREYTDGMYF